MTRLLSSLWDAPAASPPPPRRVWRDWVLVAVIPLLVLLEASTRADVPWRWPCAAMLIVLVPTLLWRRTRPLLMLAIAFGDRLGVRRRDRRRSATRHDRVLPDPRVRGVPLGHRSRVGRRRGDPRRVDHCVVRARIDDGRRRHRRAWACSPRPSPSASRSAGARVRRARELDRVKLVEREQLARDLHDTVAHHVSAIAIQAQAGTAVAATNPDAAVAALRTIEREASRTLAEMRSIVRVLRSDDAAERTPGPGIADLRALAGPNRAPRSSRCGSPETSTPCRRPSPPRSTGSRRRA